MPGSSLSLSHKEEEILACTATLLPTLSEIVGDVAGLVVNDSWGIDGCGTAFAMDLLGERSNVARRSKAKNAAVSKMRRNLQELPELGFILVSPYGN